MALKGINHKTLAELRDCEAELQPIFRKIDDIAFSNQLKVIHAMQAAGLSERHFAESTGYGYSDEGRETAERIFADAFGAQKALARPQISSGTHAIALALYGLLRPGDELVSLTGAPYDTVRSFIGAKGENAGQGTLRDFGVHYRQIEFLNGKPDLQKVPIAIGHKTKIAYLQRSTGYSDRDAVTTGAIKEICLAAKKANPNVIVFVDNCYGEFIDEVEPTQVGADLMAGSLTKNPGGGIALAGGYIAGKEKLMDQVAARLTAPGIAYEVGANFGMIRPMLLGLFLAPRTVADALKGAILTAKAFERRGLRTFPASNAQRSDIIQAVELGSEASVRKYCHAIQQASPVDAHVLPEPWKMPGYSNDIIMAAGNFVSGSSIELSADAPMRAPYTVYQQGGLTYEHAKIGLCSALAALDSEDA
ncbi:MAG: methionine gamma-lyase family protein [Eubacteriaceae bacterium]|jgi:cystathionine beta-lyase family protein involved in aluminum resistance|nr:methionine gamma-lyase family protein [Eubacteriaceae bacterium]